ncbi:MAG: preprotein translocase subunit SecY [Coprobacillus sp.]|nr:preprotein translocase subunit SecY [Coprobacillus sp.]MDY4145941.1 preprotein translocase subunit SecY [Bacilli bacterium]CCY08443.1 protein translocase subunit SecY [Coprobacillus sp. CAG:698]
MVLKNKKLWLGFAFTVLILFIYRLGYFVQLPYIRYENVQQLTSSGTMFGFLDIFSGGALSNFSIVALGVTPYITASIVVQLLQMDIIPALKEWGEEGEEGKQKLNTLTKYLAIGLGFVQALTIVLGVSVSQNDLFFGVGTPSGAMTYIYLAIVMTAGTAFVLWLADLITAKGVGNGTSLMIVVGIVASYPDMIDALVSKYLLADDAGVAQVFIFIGVILLMLVIIIGVVFMEAAQRKIPIQYANRSNAATFRGRNDSNIPIKLNSASVIPVIFASTLMSIPTTIAGFLSSSSSARNVLDAIFNTSRPIGFTVYIILIVLFTFFYSFLQMSPEKMADDLQKQSANIPGVRPGEETKSYISRVLFKVNVIGATYLAVLAALPIIISKIFDLPTSVQVGGTGLIIVVGIAIETAKQIKTAAEEKQYRGFME